MLGLTNNFAYVIMLSAAHDILSGENKSNDDQVISWFIKIVLNFLLKLLPLYLDKS